MASFRSSVFMAVLLFLMLFVLSPAIDMSIIIYDESHGGNSVRTNEEVRAIYESWLGNSVRTDEEVRVIYESWLVKHGKNYNALAEKEGGFRSLRTISGSSTSTAPRTVFGVV